MATVVCTQSALVQGQKCYACLSEKEVQAAIVFFLEARRAALAGQTARTTAQLRQMAACLGCFPTNSEADGLDAYVAQDGARAAGVAIPSITQIRNLIKGLANTSLDELRTMEITIRCQLNAFP